MNDIFWDEKEKRALIQGPGITEDEKIGTLLEAEVEIISNEKCEEILNDSNKCTRLCQRYMRHHFPNGLNDGIMCTEPLHEFDEYGDGLYTVGICQMSYLNTLFI